jgi:hypothetical protein
VEETARLTESIQRLGGVAGDETVLDWGWRRC